MVKNDSQSLSTKKLIEQALQNIGIEKGDIILVHLDATPALKGCNFNSWADALELLKKCFLNVLGPTGTLIVPTFNFDFCKGKAYCDKNTTSQTGMFSNYILYDNKSYRSFHPILSFAAVGPDAKNICDNISKSSFGKGSVFHKIHQLNSKIVFFNIGFRVCTFIHYVEQSLGVNYRFLKYFKGKVKKDNVEWEDSFDFYVRYLDRKVIPYFGRLEDYLESTGRMNKVLLCEKYTISLTKTDDIYQAIKENLIKDPYYLLKYPPIKQEV